MPTYGGERSADPSPVGASPRVPTVKPFLSRHPLIVNQSPAKMPAAGSIDTLEGGNRGASLDVLVSYIKKQEMARQDVLHRGRKTG